MERTLYVSDLDGTLLTDDCEVSPFTVEVVNAFVREGGLFTYATARSQTSARHVTTALDLRLPVILFNGTFILDLKSGVPCHACTLARGTAAETLARMDAAGILPLVYAFIDGRERVSWVRGRETDGVRRYVQERSHTDDPRLRPVDAVEQLLEGDVFYLTQINTGAAIDAMAPLLSGIPGISVHRIQDTYAPDEHWLETAPHDAGKDKALARLREMLKVDRVVCFGDNLNDIALFQASDEGYAVSNAHPALKAVATGLIGSNGEDGVARFLQRLG